jgi:putative aldouronate transport system substrate-binding protein
MKKKIVFLTLMTATISLSVFAGGRQSQSPGAGSQGSADVKVTYPITTPGVKKLTFWCIPNSAVRERLGSLNGHESFKEASKNTGVEVEYIHPAASGIQEQLNLLVASGDLPDILSIADYSQYYAGGSSAGVAEGVFMDLSEIIPVHAPDYYKLITANDLYYRLASSNDGKLTEFTTLKQSAPPYRRFNYRQDVIDRLGLDIPITIQDYSDDFAKMKAAGMIPLEPNANGLHDLFMWPFGITSGFFKGTDGKIKYGQAEPAFKQYLALMNEWYNKGYLSNDWMSNIPGAEREVRFGNGTISVIETPVDRARSVCIPLGRMSVPLPYPRLFPGQPIHFDPVFYDTRPSVGDSPFSTIISSNCKNPGIAAEFINYFFTAEGSALLNWGIKGKTYTEDASGKRMFTDLVLKNSNYTLAEAQHVFKAHAFIKLAEADVVCNPGVIVNPEALEIRTRYSDDKTVDSSQILEPIILGLEETTRRAQIMRDIDTYIGEMVLKFITNATPLSEFDNYLAQIKRMGIDEAIKITTDGYDQFWTKPSKGAK